MEKEKEYKKIDFFDIEYLQEDRISKLPFLNNLNITLEPGQILNLVDERMDTNKEFFYKKIPDFNSSRDFQFISNYEDLDSWICSKKSHKIIFSHFISQNIKSIISQFNIDKTKKNNTNKKNDIFSLLQNEITIYDLDYNSHKFSNLYNPKLYKYKYLNFLEITKTIINFKNELELNYQNTLNNKSFDITENNEKTILNNIHEYSNNIIEILIKFHNEMKSFIFKELEDSISYQEYGKIKKLENQINKDKLYDLTNHSDSYIQNKDELNDLKKELYGIIEETNINKKNNYKKMFQVINVFKQKHRFNILIAKKQKNNLIKFIYFKKAAFWKEVIYNFKLTPKKTFNWIDKSLLNVIITNIFESYKLSISKIWASENLMDSNQNLYKKASEEVNLDVLTGYIFSAQEMRSSYLNKIDDIKFRINDKKSIIKFLKIYDKKIKGKKDPEKDYQKIQDEINDKKWIQSSNYERNFNESKEFQKEIRNLFTLLDSHITLFNNQIEKLNNKDREIQSISEELLNIEEFAKSRNQMLSTTISDLKIFSNLIVKWNKDSYNYESLKKAFINDYIFQYYYKYKIPIEILFSQNLENYKEDYFSKIIISFFSFSKSNYIYIASNTFNNLIQNNKKLKKEIQDFIHNTNKFLCIVTPSILTTKNLSDYSIILYYGKIVEEGNTQNILDMPIHPYTKELINKYYRNKISEDDISRENHFNIEYLFNFKNQYDQPKYLQAEIENPNHQILATFQQLNSWNKIESDKLTNTVVFDTSVIETNTITTTNLIKDIDFFKIKEFDLFDISKKIKLEMFLKNLSTIIPYNIWTKFNQKKLYEVVEQYEINLIKEVQ